MADFILSYTGEEVEGLLHKINEMDEVAIDTTLANVGQAADAKATGDAISNLKALVGDKSVSEQISDANMNYEFITIADIDNIWGSVPEDILPESEIDELMNKLLLE